MLKKYIAEFFGTFALTVVVLLGMADVLPVATPVAAAVTLGIFVYTVGSISGSHLNPAITIALWIIKKVDIWDTIAYILVQLFGAGVAWYMLVNVYEISLGIEHMSSLSSTVAEFMGSLFFSFGIAAAISKKSLRAVKGLVIGGSLFLGILIASVGSLGILNPAVAMGAGIASASYIVGPIIGALAGVWLFRILRQR